MITKIQLGIGDKDELENLREKLYIQIKPENIPINLHICTEEELLMINQYYIFEFVNQKNEVYGIAMVDDNELYPDSSIIKIPYYFRKDMVSIRESGYMIKNIWEYISHICFEGNRKLSKQNVILENDLSSIQEMLFM